MVFGLFGVRVMPQYVVGLLACWQGKFGCHRNGYIWMIVVHYLLWCLWREINSRCYEDKERSISDLKLFFFRTLMDWLAALRTNHFYLFLISQILVIFVLNCLTPCTLLVYQGVPFLISINLLLIIKKTIKFLLFLVVNCQRFKLWLWRS